MANRSLGQLTIDLVAKTGGFIQGMNKAERQGKKWRRQVEKDMKQIGASLQRVGKITAGVVAASGVAIAEMTRRGLQNVDAQNKLARSVDGTYDSVSALQMAFEEGGIDGFERSLARLNRRLGAAELGRGGALKTVQDLNLNLQDLAEVDADERLARIADRIQSVATNSAQAARFAQDLGFEQREAAQFFMQGGDAVRAYREEVEALGLSLDSLDAIKVEQANDQFARALRVFDAISQQLAVQVAPILAGISELFIQNAKDAGGIGPAVEEAFNDAIDAAGFVIDAIEGIQRTFQVAGRSIAVFGLGVKEVLLTVARDIVELPTDAANEMINALNELPGVSLDAIGMSGLGQEIQSELDVVKGAISEGQADIHRILMEPMPSAQLKQFVADAREAADGSAEELQRIQENMRAALGAGADADGDDDLGKELQKRAAAIRQSFETERETVKRIQSETAKEIDELYQQEALSKQEADLLKLESEQRMFEELRALREEELESQKGYWQNWLESAEENLQNFDELSRSVIENFTTGFGNAVEKLVFDAESLDDALRGVADTILRGVVNSLGQMAAQWLALQAVQMAVGTSATASTVAQAATASAAWATPAAMASLATLGANSAPATAALASTTAMAQGLALTGMAHDGLNSVPKTGTYLLEEGERVTTADTSAKLDKTLDGLQSSGGGTVVNINNAPPGSRTERRTDSEGREIVDVFIADMATGGPMSRSLQNNYGLRRQGR